MIGQTLNERYRIDAELGRGGMGVVYRAYDLLLNRPVAIKLLSKEGNVFDRTHIFHEARAAAKLNHPNIIGVYDAGELAGQPYLIMELVEGASLRTHQPHSLEETLRLICQICSALEHAHASNIIHRDLKPENIILTARKTIKLMDFGLARVTVDTPSLTEDGLIIGTFVYLAPELLMGHDASPQSDLYALGLILYEMVTGRHPFNNDSLTAIISQHLHAPVVPPSTYAVELPPALDALILQMLNKIPEHRPASVAAVRQVIEQILSPAPALPAETRSQGELSILDRIARGRLVGREREIGEIKAAWRRVNYGDGQVLLISGEPGIGKTRLAREIQALAEFQKGISLFVECYAEGNVPYAPFTQALQTVFVERALVLDNLPGSILADLIAMAPGLCTIFPTILPNPPLDPQAEQQRLFESVVAFFAALTARGPVLFVIDDAHWADSGTLYLVRHLARRVRRMRLMLALTYRETELDESRALNELIAELNRERLMVRLKLARLSREQVRAMLTLMFGAEDDHVTDDFVDRLYQETEGNPFFVEEVIKTLVEEGKIYLENGRWRRASMSEIEIPQSVRVAIQSRLNKLSQATQDILRLAAIIGREFDVDLLLKASEAREDDLIMALESAERAQLIGEVQPARGGTHSIHFAFVHALIPSTLREAISGLRRLRLHRRVAEALAVLKPDDYEMLAYHFSQAGDEARAWRYSAQAGHRARSLHANQDAIRFYSEALALIPQGHAEIFNLLTARAAVYELTGQRAEQLQDATAMLTLAEQSASQADQLDALLALAAAWIELSPAQALQTAHRAAQMAEQSADWGRQGYALRMIGRSANILMDRGQARSAFERSVACLRLTNLPGEAAISLDFLALELSESGTRAERQEVLEEALALSQTIGDRRLEAINLRHLARLFDEPERRLQAQAHGEKALALFRSLGDRANERITLNILGTIYTHQGQLSQAETCYRQSLEMAEIMHSSVGIYAAVFNLAWQIFCLRGQYEAALLLFDQYIQKGQQANDRLLVSQIEATKSVLLMMMGQYAQALDLRLPRLEAARRELSRSAVNAELAFVARLQMELGQFDQAQANLDQSLKQAEETGQPLELIDALFQLIWLAQIKQGDEGLVAAFDLGCRARDICVETEFYDWIAAIHALLGMQHMLRGELDSALEAIHVALQAVQKDIYPTYLELAEWSAYRVFHAVGRSGEAREHLQRAYDRIMLVANQTRRTELRRGWLEAVYINRSVLEAWSDLGGSERRDSLNG
jgi:tetratricopeptide (TPR) repeat protein